MDVKTSVFVCCSESIGIDERLDETWVTVFGYVLLCIAVVILLALYSQILAVWFTLVALSVLFTHFKYNCES